MEKLSENKIFDGRQVQCAHASRVLRCDMQFSIYLPPQADLGSVPVIYWLSGLTCSDQNFVTKAGAQQYAAEFGVAIVCPDTSPRGEGVPDDPDGAWDFGLGAGFYLNAIREPWAEHYQMYSYVLDELPTIIEANFPVDSNRKSIFGHSMGGHGALTIALKNPEEYQSVSAFSPIVAPMQCSWGQKAFKNYLGSDTEQWKQYDSCELLGQAETKLPCLIDQGEADEFLDDQLMTDRLIKIADANDYPVQVRFQSGYDHSYYFIASFVRDHIAFHSQFLR